MKASTRQEVKQEKTKAETKKEYLEKTYGIADSVTYGKRIGHTEADRTVYDEKFTEDSHGGIVLYKNLTSEGETEGEVCIYLSDSEFNGIALGERYIYNMGWNELNLKVNTTGADYTDKSVVKEYERIDFYGFLVSIVQRLMNPKSGVKRKGILVFTRFLKEAERLTWSIPGTAIVSGETPKKEREHILEAFKAGEIPVVANVGVLTTGFDYPELDTIVMARPTMSLALWYQIVGRAIRPHPNKEAGWIVDLCGNLKRFGEVKDLRLVDSGNGKWAVYSNSRQLTNVRF